MGQLFLTTVIFMDGQIRIAIDLDYVMLPLVPDLCRYLNERHWETFGSRGPEGIQPCHFAKYSLAHAMGWEPGRGLEYIREFEGTPEYANMEPNRGSVDAIDFLSQYYEMHVVTRRRDHTRRVTVDCIMRNYPGVYDETRIHVIGGSNGHLPSKVPKLREIGASLMLDDHGQIASELATAGRPVLLMDRPWNSHVKNTDMIRRVFNWDRVPAAVDQMTSRFRSA